jgi:hypothetical protein
VECVGHTTADNHALTLPGAPVLRKSVQGGENGKANVGAFISQKRGNLMGFNIVPIQLPYIQEEGKSMSQEEGKTKNLLWWMGLIALLILIIVGGLYLRYKFWSGVF